MNEDRNSTSLTSLLNVEWFRSEEVLTAVNLNDAFRRTATAAFLAAAAPPAAGLFRPWWWGGDAKSTNQIKLEDDGTVVIEGLFASLVNGTPLFVERGETTTTGSTVFLKSTGSLESGTDFDDADGLILAKREKGGSLRIVAPVAALDATEEIANADERVREAAEKWQDEAANVHGVFGLAEAFGNLARGGDLPARRIRLLSEMAETVLQHLNDSPEVGAVPKSLSELTRLPESTAHDSLCEWLGRWADIFENQSLLRSFFAPRGWLYPEKVGNGCNWEGQTWWRFNLSDLENEVVELFSSRPLARARWRFEDSGNINAFRQTTVREDGWSVTFRRQGAKELFVLADELAGKELRLRADTMPEE